MTTQFESPKLLTARRHIGFVDVPDNAIEEAPLELMPQAALKGNRRSIFTKSADQMPGPTSLKRAATMSGTIIVIEESNEAYWLARKVEDTHTHGITRLGYKLRPNSREEFKNANGAWELDIDESCLHPIVTIKMMHTNILDKNSEENRSVHSPLNELSYLQMIGNGNRHVDGANAVATCSNDVYVVLPYHRDGTLEEYCRFQGNLPESLARFFFRQILEGIQTLQNQGLYHRDLSLESIGIDGNYASILESRFPLRASKVSDDSSPTIPGVHSIQYLCPAYFGSQDPHCGFAADLWAVGLVLFGMVVGHDALFLAPVADDPVFVQLCKKGKVKSYASKYGKLIGKTIDLSDNMVDLLQKMLKGDPKDRLKLDQILEHPWVKNEELMTPDEWNEKKMAESALPPIVDEGEAKMES